MPEVRIESVDDRLVAEVKRLIQEADKASLSRLTDQMRPADVADLIEFLNPEERIFIFSLLEPVGAGDVLVEIEPPVQGLIIDDLDTKAISEIVSELDSDDAADLIGDMPEQRAMEVMAAVEENVSEELKKLLPYPQDTAGGIMALEFVAVNEGTTIGDSIEIIRDKKEKVENLYYVWVTDDRGRLTGVLSLKDLVLEPPYRKIKEIMNPEVISVKAHMDQEEVAQLVKKYDLVSVPVLDDQNRLIGRITHDDIIDVIEDEVDEDISLMAGVIPQEIGEESYFKISRARLPWLIAGLFGGVLAAAVINQFEESLERILALSFFFPVIMAMGGNTGTQASTVAVRGLATGDINLMNIGRRLWVEMKVALVNGIVCGIILGIVVGTWLSDYALGGVISLSLVIIIINSGFIGAAVPIALKKLNIDPALATGPFVTTSNDILGLLIYLGLVTVFLRFAS